MQVKVRKKFRDIPEEMKTRKPGEVLTVAKERGEYLVQLGLAEEVIPAEKKRKNAAE